MTIVLIAIKRDIIATDLNYLSVAMITKILIVAIHGTISKRRNDDCLTVVFNLNELGLRILIIPVPNNELGEDHFRARICVGNAPTKTVMDS